MNKKHWSTIKIDGEVKDPFLKDILKESYDIVFKSLTKVIKKEIMKNQPNPEFPLPLNSDPI
jgi:predicted DNA-binding protein (MmcQ/YjbR family)